MTTQQDTIRLSERREAQDRIAEAGRPPLYFVNRWLDFEIQRGPAPSRPADPAAPRKPSS